MGKVHRFTPVRFEGEKTVKQRLCQGVEDYFYLGGKVAYVLQGNVDGKKFTASIRDADQSNERKFLLGAVKILSYTTVLIPMVMLSAKVAVRKANHFYTATPKVHVAQLMEKFTDAWNADEKTFDFSESPFDLVRFTKRLEKHTLQFSKEGISSAQQFGYIEKFDLDPAENSQIYMRADLHGDLKSLIENLRSLHEQGLLDDNYKCKPGVHLVFLGDYCDRGYYGTYILELLMRLREENPEQVHLIRGNHEDSETNWLFAGNDFELRQLLKSDEASKVLDKFYETMSLTTYFSVNGSESREYIQCTHGLFEVSMDPAPLLDDARSQHYIAVPRERVLSNRIRKLGKSDSPLTASAKRIRKLVERWKRSEAHATAYNWGDVHADKTHLGTLTARTYNLSPRDIRHYLDISSEQHRVEMLFRGHQHGFQHFMHEDKVIATTLPVGMNSPGYQKHYEQPDRAYIIKPALTIAEWSKRAMLRETGHDRTDEITKEFALTSGCI